ncbi:NTP transferase domain-containing protein [Micromonospora sp. WMMD1082]|uniref:molybdenum cofactor guanylyltransferase n=1 Tax=Micromonospora sp. WMMD1082 TaxID=3016104 RepID=UPI003242AA62
MGGRDKPALPVGGVPMRERVLAAVADAAPRILVGPGPALTGVRLTREVPPGGGPVPAIAAGLDLLDPDVPAVALLAADLPLLTRAAVGELLRHLHGTDLHSGSGTGTPSTARPAGVGIPPGIGSVGVDGVCFVDGLGRRQTLCGVWRPDALRTALDRLAGRRGGELAGAPLRDLLTDLAVREVAWTGDGPEPWFDCDTERDVRRAEEWTR